MNVPAKNSAAFHARLKKGDSLNETVGCRHTQPLLCDKHSIPKLCAIVRVDGICKAPPASWPRQFKKLKDQVQKAK